MRILKRKRLYTFESDLIESKAMKLILKVIYFFYILQTTLRGRVLEIEYQLCRTIQLNFHFFKF